MSGTGTYAQLRNRRFTGDQGGTLTGTDQPSWLVGGLGADTLFGGIGNDSLFGGFGNDSLDGGGGHDRLFGEAGNDTLRGGAGNDTLRGDIGDDLLDGGDGADSIFGGIGNDFVWGGAGNDTVEGNDGNDIIRSGEGDDLLLGGLGDDILCAAAGNDVLMSSGGNDTLWGGDGNDLAKAGYGNDLVTGGNGNDTLRGCEGNDILLSRSDAGEPTIAANPATPRVFAGITMTGNDMLGGGPGANLYRFELLVNAAPTIVQKWTRPDGTIDWAGVVTENGSPHDHWVDGIGNDTVEGFSRANGDRLEVFGHDVEVASIIRRDTDANGKLDSIVALRSKAGGAHAGDLLGTITVLDEAITVADLNLRDVVVGAFSTLEFGQFPGDRFGTFPVDFNGLGTWM